LRVDLTRVDYWLSVGAKPSERVSHLIKDARTLANAAAEAAPAPAVRKPPRPRRRRRKRSDNPASE